MNILLVERDCFSEEKYSNQHTSANSLQFALTLRSYTQGRVYILAKEDSLYEKIALDYGFEVIHEPKGFALSLALSKIFRTYEISILHTFDLSSAEFFKSAFFLPSKVIHIHTENRYNENKDLLKSKLFKNTHSFIFAHKSFKDHYFKEIDGANTHIFQITNIECPQLSKNEENKASDIAENKKLRFLIPAPIELDSTLENILLALQLFEQFEGYNLDWEAFFFGYGNNMNAIIQKAEELNISENIAIIKGSYENFIGIDAALCIFPVNTKEYNIDPLLLAWKNSLPTLLTSQVPYLNFTKNSENVFIADISTPASLSGALHRLISEKALRKTLATNGFSSLKEYCKKDEKNKYVDFLSKLEK